MKILFSDFTLPYLLKDSEYPVGGWAVELSTWLKGLVQIEQQAGVLTWKGGCEYVNKELDFDLLDTYDPAKGIPVFKYLYQYIPCQLRVVKKYNPDVIIQSCGGLTTGILAFIANRLKIPFVYRAASDEDANENFIFGWKYSQYAYRYGLKKTNIILAQNEYQKKCFAKHFSAQVDVLHNPFDTAKIPSHLVPRINKNYIAWLGVFRQAKNMPLLLEIAKKTPDIEFRVAGMLPKNTAPDTVSAVGQLHKLPNVNFVGYVQRKDVLDFLAGAVALLSTSHYEGFSNTFLEALISGTPVISPRRVDPDHIITNNQLGLTAEQDEMLPELVNQIWNTDHRQYDELSMKCRSYVLVSHDPAAKARELVDILKPLVQGIS